MTPMQKISNKNINILDIARETASKIRRRGNEYEIPCFFCNDDSHLFINPKKNVFRCVKCGRTGNIITFLAERDSITKSRAVGILLGEDKKRTIKPTAQLEITEHKRHVYFKGKGEASNYDYRNEEGKIIYKKVKFYKNNKKCFCYYEYVNGVFLSGMGQAKPTLYNLTSIIKNTKDAIYIVEGEKDCQSLTRLGLLATTSGSTDSWKDEFKKYFINRKVCIIPDCDNVGVQYSEKIKTSIESVVSELKVVDLGLQKGEDVTDYLHKHSKKDLFKLIKNTFTYIGGNTNE